MTAVKAYGAQSATSPIAPLAINRRPVGADDVLIDIEYCGVCHSDLHMARNEWGGTMYPIVPGHEIVGKVVSVGGNVTKFKVGDTAGIGCIVDSCRTCASCNEGLEQYCENGMVGTYNGKEKATGNVTYGGYSTKIVVDQSYLLHISPKLDLKAVAPLLCAGITTWSPLKQWKVGKGQKVAIVGLGGLGHMGVKFAVALGADVTVLSTSKSKEADAKKLGAHHFAVTSNPDEFNALVNTFDFILDTVSAPHDINAYLGLLRRDGTMVVVGVPPTPTPISNFPLIMKRRRLAGSLIGGIKETQEMLDFCAEHNIVSEIEMINIKDINIAYERMIKSDVKYRFVIDIATLEA